MTALTIRLPDSVHRKIKACVETGVRAIAGASIRRMKRLVVDTNVFIAELIGEAGAAREVLRRCLTGRYEPCMSLALFAEYRDLLGRRELLSQSALDATEREDLFHDLLSVSHLV